MSSYLRAAEVGRPPTSSKYELHLKLKTLKNGAVVRNRLRLPHPVRTDIRVAVICDPTTPAGIAALKAGASIVGEETIFEAVKEGRIEFDRCVCHTDSLAKLNKAGLGRVLGPRGLMPSAKTGTVIKDVGASVKDMVGASEYRERMGVVRMAVGQLGYTPEELQRNIRAFVENVRKDMAGLSDRIAKDIHEVVSLCLGHEIVDDANHSAGPELDEWTGIESEWRFQKPGFDSDKRSFDHVTTCIDTPGLCPSLNVSTNILDLWLRTQEPSRDRLHELMCNGSGRWKSQSTFLVL